MHVYLLWSLNKGLVRKIENEYHGCFGHLWVTIIARPEHWSPMKVWSHIKLELESEARPSICVCYWSDVRRVFVKIGYNFVGNCRWQRWLCWQPCWTGKPGSTTTLLWSSSSSICPLSRWQPCLEDVYYVWGFVCLSSLPVFLSVSKCE